MAEINALEHMNTLLQSKPKIQKLGFRVEKLPPFGILFQKPYSYESAATVVNSRVIRVISLEFDKTRVTSLPETGILTRKTIHNCADVVATSSIGMTLTGTQSWSVTKTEGVTTTVGTQLNGSVGVPGVSAVGVNFSFSNAFTTSTAHMEGGSQQVTRSSNETVTVPPKRAIEIELFAYQCAAEIPFSALVIIDGDLEENLSGIKVAGEILTEAERTLPVKGSLRLAEVSDASLRTRDLSGAQGCDGSNTLRISSSDITAFPTETLGNYFSSGFKPLNAQRILEGELVALRHFAEFTWPENEGPVIGPPDGIHYEVLYTTQVFEPCPVCGFNDVGAMNLGIFNVEARQYRNYVNGQLISQWQENIKTFSACQITF